MTNRVMNAVIIDRKVRVTSASHDEDIFSICLTRQVCSGTIDEPLRRALAKQTGGARAFDETKGTDTSQM